MDGISWRAVALFAGIFLGSLGLSLAVTAVVIVRIPADYFTHQRRQFMPGRNPALRIVLRVLKNLLGVAVVAVGIVTSIPGVPGQGFLTILIGLMLLDFPGKFAVERWIIRRRAIRGAANWLRRKAGRPPLETP
jgi:hypothetical protein